MFIPKLPPIYWTFPSVMAGLPVDEWGRCYSYSVDIQHSTHRALPVNLFTAIYTGCVIVSPCFGCVPQANPQHYFSPRCLILGKEEWGVTCSGGCSGGGALLLPIPACDCVHFTACCCLCARWSYQPAFYPTGCPFCCAMPTPGKWSECTMCTACPWEGGLRRLLWLVFPSPGGDSDDIAGGEWSGREEGLVGRLKLDTCTLPDLLLFHCRWVVCLHALMSGGCGDRPATRRTSHLPCPCYHTCYSGTIPRYSLHVYCGRVIMPTLLFWW